MLQAVLFDLDGTLMDHDAARDAGFAAHLPDHHAAHAAEWRRLEELHYHDYVAGRVSFTEQRRRRVRGIHAAMGHAEPAGEACDAWFAAYLTRYRAGWTAFDDVLPALAALTDAHDGLVMGVITNGEGEPQRAKLAAIGLTEQFPIVVCSGEVGLAKPDPAIFLLACEQVGVDPGATAYVGDRLDLDAQGAAAAGLRGIWLDRAGGGVADGVTTIASLRELPAAVAILPA